MSTTELEVLQAIQEGMRRALSDATTFTEDFKAAINTEYLATVNIAQRLALHCPLVGRGDLRIALEKRTRDFASEALPLMNWGDDLNLRWSFRKRLNATRNGRVDIALAKGGPGSFQRSWCAIEIKGFSPQARVVKLDLRRNIEFLIVEGPTGNSSVELTVFCAFHDCKGVFLDTHKALAEQKVAARYEKMIDELKVDPRIRTEVSAFPVSSRTATGEETPEEQAYLDDIHHYVGVLVVFRRKQSAA